MEIVADRTTHKFAGRTEVSYDIQVNVDTFTGTVTASVFDVNGGLTEGPTSLDAAGRQARHTSIASDTSSDPDPELLLANAGCQAGR
jgi:hypothetical protein